MLTMHPTLLIGPADWDAERFPQQEFATRIARLWQRFPEASGAIVYGDSRDHAVLAWLTNFTPKLEPTIALIPREGAPRLMVGGGATMVPSTQPLTWVTDLVPLRPTAKTISDWLKANGGGRCICIGTDAMPTRLHRELDAAFEGKTPQDHAARVLPLMQDRSANELACIREASEILQHAADAMADAQRGGKGVSDVVLAGEHAAIARKAQDVRTMFSLNGGRSYRPFELPIPQAADPLSVYIAVCRLGYWAEGYLTLAGGSATLRPTA